MVIGRELDFAMVSVMVISSAYFVSLYASGVPATSALLAGLAVATVVGLVQGWLIAYGQAPPMFTTLAMSVSLYGLGQLFLVPQDVSNIPSGDNVFSRLGAFRPLGVPIRSSCCSRRPAPRTSCCPPRA